jgi:glucokinase
VGPVVGIDVGGSAIKGEVLDAEHRPLATARTPTPGGSAPAGDPGDADGTVVLDAVAALARELLRAVPAGGPPPGAIGVGVPGIVEPATGVVVFSANLGWRDVPVGRELGDALGRPVVVSHDVAAAGLAELRLGAGRGAQDVLFVVIGTGVAAAALVGGRLLVGGAGQAGEIGHLRLRPDGPTCGCGGRGCLETLASARAVAAAYTARTGRTVRGAAEVVAALPTDPDARAVWADAVGALADGLLITQAVLAPARVVLGGGLAAAGRALLDPLERALRERATVQRVPELRLAELGERAGVVGAALAARETVRAGPPGAGTGTAVAGTGPR